MKRDLRFILVSLLFVALSSMFAFGQETTGNIEITLKDTAGAVVPNVPVTVSSTGQSTGYKRTLTTDDSGFVRLVQVPPGTYSVTAAATSGFVEKKVNEIGVSLGKTTPVLMEMSTSVGASVTVTAGDVTGIDVTSTKMQDTISAQTAELIPKGLNFSTVLKYSPATRPEPRSGQFQIDGASGSENTFIVDGQEVTDIQNGALDRNSNLPFSIVQEVQVKTSGFEAEYGGATGGVINVVTKGGGNGLHGEFGINLRTSRAEPIAGAALRSNAGVPEYYPSRRYQFNETNPEVSVQGPIWKNRVWFSVAYAPQILTQNRVLVYRANDTRIPTGRVEHYYAKTRDEKTFGRLDAQPFSRLHLTSTFQWNPEAQTGRLPSFSSELSTVPSQPGNPSFDGARFINQTGGRLNSVNFTAGGAYSVTNNLIVTARFGHYFLNNKLGTYGGGDVTVPRVSCAPNPISRDPFPANFGCVRGGNNGVTAITASLYDAFRRDQFDADATYLFSIGGRHELKGGYQKNAIGNKVQQQDTDIITLRSGTTSPSTVGAFSGHNTIPSTPGAIGSGEIDIIQTQGDVHSKNTGIFIQDKWQPTRRLTLNLGVRTERENVPSYSPGLPGLNFSFSSKIAPRLGAAYDLTGDGKTKISAFYGLFYDRFKLELPRGSFGGDKFHQVFFEFFPGDTIANINRATIFGNGDLIPGGACPLTQLAPVYGRVRCDVDQRVNSNSGGPLLEVGGIDPNIRPFQQREITLTFQRQLTTNYLFSARYSRKQVLHAIEDAGFPNSTGTTAYIIGNPGEGLYKEQTDRLGLIAPKPQRQYDALELRLDRRFANNFFFSANYTLSRLYGNYGGLASSDEEGRLSPNVNRYFDEPSAEFTVKGGPDNGRLATDRPHVLKMYGTYRLNWDRFGLWKANTTDFEVFTTATSGSLITSFVNIHMVEQIVLTKRGDQGRTPLFTQTDFAVHHSIKFGKDGRFTLKMDADFINVFNQHIVTNLGLNPDGQGGNLINNTDFDPLNVNYHLVTQAQVDACNTPPRNLGPCYVAAFHNFQLNGSPEILAAAQAAAGHNPFYNLPSGYQAKRTIRYGIRLVF